jgi:hypothetical protein
MYATLVLGVSIVALLCYPLPGESPLASTCKAIVEHEHRSYIPEFLPGKRALAIGLCVYHSVISTVLFQAPRFIPFSFGPFFEASARAIHLRYTRTTELIFFSSYCK